MTTVLRWGFLLSALGGLVGCGSPPEESSGGDNPTRSTEQPMKNATLHDHGGAIVEVRIPLAGSGTIQVCTGSLINQNSLITAASCGKNFMYTRSYMENVAVVSQEDSTSWRCLTNLHPDGTIVRGSHDSVLVWCSGRPAAFTSALDYGPTQSTCMPPDCADANDFAVVKVSSAGFSWYGTSDYLALYASAVQPGWSYAFGRGVPDENGLIDHRMRLDPFYIFYSNAWVLEARGTEAQLCAGDIGGPVGVWMANGRFAVQGVANWPPNSSNAIVYGSRGFCGTSGGATFWHNVPSWIWYVEAALGKTCRTVDYGSVRTKECWD
jgi:hypothetical protein